MIIELENGVVRHQLFSPVALLLAAVFSTEAAAVQDVLLQTMNAKIVTGIVDDQSGVGTLGQRVYGGQFQLVSGNFRASNPGFFGLRSGDAVMPPGASGFPSQHPVSFDLLPMSIEAVASNLFYWDGSDVNGGGVDITDVDFVVPTDVNWDVFDANFSMTTADGSDQLVPGGLIQTTSSDIWPDGVDSGTIHKHLALQVRDNDGNSSTTPPAGVYLISWQARSVGFEASEPFFFVHRSPAIADSIRDLAVSWVKANIEMLPGDYNDDSIIDAADYVVWRKFDGTSTKLPNDPNAVPIDNDQYDTWRGHFGATTGSGSGASVHTNVPEPATLVMLIVAAVGIRSRRRHFVS